MRDMAGELIMSTLEKHVQVFAVDMDTAPLEQSAFATMGTMVGTANLNFTTLQDILIYFEGPVPNVRDLVCKSCNINVLSGDDCALWISDLPNSIKDNFESGSVSEDSWSLIQGGGVSSGCGQLSPHAHGDSLYFNGCKMRHAVSKPLDLSRARYITQYSNRPE